MNSSRKKRCPNGTRRNKKTGECESINRAVINVEDQQRVDNVPKVDNVEDIDENFFSVSSRPRPETKKKRCPKGTRRNKKSGNCEPTNQKERRDILGKDLFESKIQKEPTQMIKTPSIVKKHLAAKKLQMFMNRTKHQRTALFLKTICSDSGVCIAFGKESDKIKKFFNGFTDFSYVIDKRMIGDVSANGFVYEISYSHKGYNAHTILKSSQKPSADNLMYEYAVGKEINTRFNKFSPCFLETYGLYKYKNETEWSDAKNKMNPAKKLDSMIVKLNNDADYAESCSQSKLICVLIQHIKNSKTLHHHMSSNFFLQYQLLYVMYQVYFTLSIFSTQFTHYDLHANNVMLFEPVADKYIHYHYHFSDNKIVSFKSSYISKIIDYGRCFVSDLSKKYYRNICITRECDPNCGHSFGYRWFAPPDKGHYYISSERNNISSDLRLLNFCLSGDVKNNCIDLYNIATKIVYSTPYGTKQNKTTGFPNSVNNVVDAEKFLRELVLNPNYIASNNHFYTGTDKLGDLHIYSDREMNYVPAV
jgi:hypothetical protein